MIISKGNACVRPLLWMEWSRLILGMEHEWMLCKETTDHNRRR